MLFVGFCRPNRRCLQIPPHFFREKIHHFKATKQASRCLAIPKKHPRVMTLLQFLLLVAVPPLAHSHSRWQCPAPRSSSTGIKNGPCGSQPLSIYQTDSAIDEIKPGPLRIIFEESIHHTGAPFRISLSNDGTDDDACVLLDHIPHNDCCQPDYFDESSYTKYVLTIEIPNVSCERCSLHLSNPMTDKIGIDGSPNGIG